MPRQGSAASRKQFGLVNHVAGSGSPGDSGYDKRATSSAGYPSPSDYDDPFSDDCAGGGLRTVRRPRHAGPWHGRLLEPEPQPIAQGNCVVRPVRFLLDLRTGFPPLPTVHDDLVT